MRKLVLVVALIVAASLTVVAAVAIAGGGNGGGHRAMLNGYNEVVGGPGPSIGSVSTVARGTFRARVRKNPTRVDWTLTYSGIEGGAVTQAHPHFAQRHVGGGIFGFLCGGPKPPCPPSGTVTGTWTAADVIGPADQGVAPGQIDEFIRAMRAGAVYVNVHSTAFPEGEIRGQVRRGHGNDDD